MIVLRKFSQASVLLFGLFAAGLAWSQAAAVAEQRLALKGYDPVAFFTDNKAVKGTPAIHYEWDEGRYQFSSDKNKFAFASNPDRYTPQFAGFCTGGLAKGMKAEANPEFFMVVDGKLYAFSSAKARDAANANPDIFASAAKNWKEKK